MKFSAERKDIFYRKMGPLLKKKYFEYLIDITISDGARPEETTWLRQNHA